MCLSECECKYVRYAYESNTEILGGEDVKSRAHRFDGIQQCLFISLQLGSFV